MRRLFPFLLAALAACATVPTPQVAAPGTPPPASPETQLAIYLGVRTFDDEDFWIPNEDQDILGIEYAQDGPENGVGWEVGLAFSRDESNLGAVEWTGRTGEVYAGLRKSFGHENVRPYLGGGLSFLNAEWETSGFSDNDTTLAGYVHGGMEFLASRTFFLGVDLRLLFGSDIELGGFGGDADYRQAAFIFGWRF